MKLQIKKHLKVKVSLVTVFILIISCVVFLCYAKHKKYYTKNNYPTHTTRELNIQLTKEEKRLFTFLVYSETRDESYETKLAFSNLIINRILHSQYPNNIIDVIYSNNSFNSTSNGALDKHLWEYDSGIFNTKSHTDTIKAIEHALGGTNNIGNRTVVKNFWYKKDYTSYKSALILDNHIFI